jgi:hypothetical protein
VLEQAALLVKSAELFSGVLAERPTLPHTVRSRTIETPEMRMAPVLRIRPPVICMDPPLAGCGDPCKAIDLALVQRELLVAGKPPERVVFRWPHIPLGSPGAPAREFANRPHW